MPRRNVESGVWTQSPIPEWLVFRGLEVHPDVRG
uniref:Uncharacterized protein n=1 Tax=Anguilla anguilla TaxID=7936 RepID=A0A0E9XWQ0_ANGAN